MLFSPPVRNLKNEREGEMDGQGRDFSDFSVENLLDGLDFDGFFVGISDGDVLPDLEMDTEIFAEFSAAADEVTVPSAPSETSEAEEKGAVKDLKGETMSSSVTNSGKETPIQRKKGAEKGRKSAAASSKRLASGKKKAKVDWTPELHRKFVQAVEQMGIDKAVPSKILELMGNDSLTRHNVASHLQKYRSHQKHLLAREAAAARWNQSRQIPAAVGSLPATKSHWIAPPIIGFPPVPQFRPLQVWGHPSVDQSIMPAWHTHLPPADPSAWMIHYHAPPPGIPYFPPSAVTQRFLPPAGNHWQGLHQVPSEFHPSTESVDAAIGDALSKPSLPLPLGLKPPSVDSVIAELRRQGISKIPPT